MNRRAKVVVKRRVARVSVSDGDSGRLTFEIAVEDPLLTARERVRLLEAAVNQVLMGLSALPILDLSPARAKVSGL